MVTIRINGAPHEGAEASRNLLSFIRFDVGLTGTKYGCGEGVCGACTIHEDGRAVRACMIPIAEARGRRFTTIEGLGAPRLHAVQRAWLEHDVAQCGYCQPGMIMASKSMLARIPKPTDEDINREITNICRCGTYYEIRRAIHRAAGTTAGTR